MNSLSVGKKDYAQIPAAHFSDWRPTANAAVLLDRLLYRMIDDALNPLILNNSAVGPNTHCLKVLSGFHCSFLCEPSTRAIFGNQNGAVAMLSSFKPASDFFRPAQTLLHQFVSRMVSDCVSRRSVRVVEFLNHFTFQLARIRSAERIPVNVTLLHGSPHSCSSCHSAISSGCCGWAM